MYIVWLKRKFQRFLLYNFYCMLTILFMATDHCNQEQYHICNFLSYKSFIAYRIFAKLQM